MYISTTQNRVHLSVALSILTLVTTQAVAAVCTAGQIDTAFGTSSDNGFVQTSPFVPSSFCCSNDGVAVDPSSGALFAVVMTGVDAASNFTSGITKLSQGGKRDTTFGGIGYALAGGQLTGGGTNVLADLAGNVLLTTNGASGISLFRFSNAGVPDASFGNSGMANASLSSVSGGITSIRQQPSDGKYLVVASAANAGAGGQNQPVVIRFNTDGSLDNSFGNGGIAFIFPSNVIDPNALGVGTDLAVLPSGSILVSARVKTTGIGVGSYWQPFVARLLPTGALDPSFGTSNGLTLYDFGESVRARRMALQSDGKIVLAGGTLDVNNVNRALIIRTNANGAPDPSFGTNSGWTQITQGSSIYAWSVAIQNNDKIVLGATEYLDVDQTISEPVAIRLTKTGQLDPAFGSGGFVAIPSPNGGIAFFGNDIRIDPNSKIVFNILNANPAPRIDGASYLVRLDTGTGSNCH